MKFIAGENCWCHFCPLTFFENFHELDNAELWNAYANVSALRNRKTAAVDYFQVW